MFHFILLSKHFKVTGAQKVSLLRKMTVKRVIS